MSSSQIKQVTRSTFTPSLLKTLSSQISTCDFIALSSVTTAASSSSSSAWRRRVFPFDTPQTAYLKAKQAAESYGVVNLSVCPARVDGSRTIAFPYNFHLFPREELKPGLPSYSFSCQSSHLQCLAREGFDFNLCIYEGISYLSRVQESYVGQQNPTYLDFRIPSLSSRSVADSLFLERVKSRIRNWRKLQSDSSKSPHGDMTNSLRNIILGTQMYGPRPCMMIDVSSDHQISLVLQIISGISDSLVPLVAHENGGIARSIRVILTSSEEDKSALLSDIERTEEEQNFKLHGFREVIDLISSSQKPIVSYNCLDEFTFIHEKFIAPLPPSMHEFACSLKMVFPKILDLGHLMKEIGSLRNNNNVSSDLSYLNQQLFSSMNLEVPFQADSDSEQNNQGSNILKITSLFAKITKFLNINQIEAHTNIFHPISCTELDAINHQEDAIINHLTIQEDITKWSAPNLLFIWGFNSSSLNLKQQLKRYHPIFSEVYSLRVLDRNCAVVAFQRQSAVVELLKEVETGSNYYVQNMLSDGINVAEFGAYKKVCDMGLWDGDLADSLQTAMLLEKAEIPVSVENNSSKIYWDSEFMLDPNEYIKV